ncbi:MAG: phosphatase PAP2 family protein [Arcticibacter sp.]
MRQSQKVFDMFRMPLVKFFLAISVSWLFCCTELHAQRDSISEVRVIWQDAGKMLSEPKRWNQADWAAFVGVSAGTMILFQFDLEIESILEDSRRRSVMDLTSYGFEPFGNGLYTLPLLAGLGAYGKLKGEEQHVQVAFAGLEAFVFSAGGATCSKWIFQRQRPSDNIPLDPFVFEGPLGDLRDDGSFVSRHAASAFAVATVLASCYGKQKKWVPWLAYGLAGAVTASRVYNGKHWSSDAFAGAAFGVVTGKFVYRMRKSRGLLKTF